MTNYEIQVDLIRPLNTMDILLDAVEEKLKSLGYSHGEYELTVCGPPELRIGVIMK